MLQLVLASASPRRRQLLPLANLPFRVQIAGVDEASISDPDPARIALLAAQAKANAVAADLSWVDGDELLVVAADTLVALDGQPLGKPPSASAAVEMLVQLRGRQHEVHTALALRFLRSGETTSATHTAKVTMRDYSLGEIETYVASGDPLDKAGSYAIQSVEFHPVAHIQGCYNGIMGLSICHLQLIMAEMGIPLRGSPEALAAAHEGYECPLYDELVGLRGAKNLLAA